MAQFIAFCRPSVPPTSALEPRTDIQRASDFLSHRTNRLLLDEVDPEQPTLDLERLQAYERHNSKRGSAPLYGPLTESYGIYKRAQIIGFAVHTTQDLGSRASQMVTYFSVPATPPLQHSTYSSSMESPQEATCLWSQ